MTRMSSSSCCRYPHAVCSTLPLHSRITVAFPLSICHQTEIIPLCLRIMETGSELSKTVATFIVQKILLDETGLNYICATAERFYAVSTVLSIMVSILVEQPSHRLLKHIVRCYLRLSDNLRAREALRQCLPDALRDSTFAAMLKNDAATKRWLTQLVGMLAFAESGGASVGAAPPVPVSRGVM